PGGGGRRPPRRPRGRWRSARGRPGRVPARSRRARDDPGAGEPHGFPARGPFARSPRSARTTWGVRDDSSAARLGKRLLPGSNMGLLPTSSRSLVHAHSGHDRQRSARMTHYKSNLRDLEFNLFEVFKRQDVLGTGPFAELDEDTARTILDEVNRLATGVVAESFEDADRNPPVFDPQTSTVALPESLKKSYRAYMDAGWYNLDLPQELGGLGAPRSLVWGAAELILGANPSIHMYSAGPGFANVLYQEGTEKQKGFANLAIERGWGATMVLTEPDAGSDVGAGRTKAVDQGDGTWHIEGVKRFITSAEQDMTENIFHLVLARPEGAKPGTKGLSLFLVPKYLVNEDGSLGERNGAYVTNVEHKMGLKASTTCELTFGAKHPAIGYLVGDKHDGIRQMFLIIEYARMMVGTKAIATLSTGYLNALEYAKERKQGADLTQMADKTAPRVTITHHPDVRRSLMTQKAYAEALRALVIYTASQQDAVQ